MCRPNPKLYLKELPSFLAIPKAEFFVCFCYFKSLNLVSCTLTFDLCVCVHISDFNFVNLLYPRNAPAHFIAIVECQSLWGQILQCSQSSLVYRRTWWSSEEGKWVVQRYLEIDVLFLFTDYLFLTQTGFSMTPFFSVAITQHTRRKIATTMFKFVGNLSDFVFYLSFTTLQHFSKSHRQEENLPYPKCVRVRNYKNVCFFQANLTFVICDVFYEILSPLRPFLSIIYW